MRPSPLGGRGMISIFAAALASSGPLPANPKIVAPPPVVRTPSPPLPPPPPIARVPSPPLPPQPAPPPEAVAEAIQLFDRDQLHDQMIAGMLLSVRERMGASAGSLAGERSQELAERFQAALTPVLERIIGVELDNFRQQMAIAYARRFTLQELRDLNRLFRDPIFQRMQQLTPLLLLDASEVGARVFSRYEDEFRQLGEDVARQWLEDRGGETPSSS